MSKLEWSELDERAVKMARALAADAVQHVGNGHPGTAMALAPAAYLLFQRHLRHDPTTPDWEGRDRFVLSIGHSSLTLYTQLFLSGYGLEISDLQQFRKAGSRTPGHPEYGHTVGVETTTGPLGQGIANAVGMAMAAQYRRSWAGDGDFAALADYQVYCLAGDGCMQEGIAAEAASLAGTLKLPNLILVYDDNEISIDGPTDLAFTEDVAGRFRAYGWEVLNVPKLADGDIDLVGLDAALTAARAHTAGPVLIRLETTIGFPAPHLKGLAKTHGSALGADEVAATKVELGLDPEVNFYVDQPALEHARQVADRGAAVRREWEAAVSKWAAADSEGYARYRSTYELPSAETVAELLPKWEVGEQVATRKAGQAVLNAVAPQLPVLWGGSADLAESNGTLLKAGGSVSAEHMSNRNIHFGIREHAMAGIMNGLALAGLRPYGATFLVFSDYMRGAIRLSALMQLPTTYVLTHDSVGVGEDGPTHQPVEHLASLRLMPHLSVVRPADANETAAAWQQLLISRQAAALVLSRQDLPVVVSPAAAIAGVSRGGYVVRGAVDPQLTIVATGSEVHLALEAAVLLDAAGISSQVVSMPCVEWFEAQPADYRSSVLRNGLPVLVVEAGATGGWYRYADEVVGIDTFGASAAPAVLFAEHGFTPLAVAECAKRLLG